MNRKAFTSICCVGALLVGCQTPAPTPSPTPTLQTYSNISLEAGFDTFFSVQEASESQESFDASFQEASALFTYYNNLFDIYNDYDGMNNLKTINDQAGIAPVKVDQDLIECLQLAQEFYTLSNGEFDITMGNLLKVWHQYREDGIAANEVGKYGTVPSYEELQNAFLLRGWDKVEIDPENQTVFITDPNVSLDVGGIAKGFATEKIAQQLEADGITMAAINAGGNNRTIGIKLDGSDWRVGIQDPAGEGSLCVVLRSGSWSFVTSGDYERYYVADDGNVYPHIIDPSTLYPATHFHSVSIITQNSGVADCLSTTLFTLSLEDGQAFLDAYTKAHPEESVDAIWLLDKDTPDVTCEKVVDDYCVIITDGLKGSMEWK